MKIIAFLFGLIFLALPSAAQATYLCAPDAVANAAARSIYGVSGILYNLDSSGCTTVTNTQDLSWFPTQGFTNPSNGFATIPIPGSALAPGAAANNLAVNQISPTDTRYGALCDGAATDSTAFLAALAASNLVVLPVSTAGVATTCIVGNLVVNDNQILDCNNAILKAAPGSQWIIKKRGFHSVVRNCVPYDPLNVTMQSTTLVSGGAPGSTALTLASATGFQPNMILSIQLASGAYWTNKIKTVVGNVVTISDPIPYTVTAATLNAGGTGYVNGDEAVLLGGTGAPATINLAVTAGAITGVNSIDSPGLYQISPPAIAAPFDPLAATAYNGALNITYGGANTGAYVDAAFGVYLVDNAVNGETSNVVIPQAPVGFEVMSIAGQTTQEVFRNIQTNASPIAAFVKLQGVNNISVSNAVFYGTSHHASTYGGACVYIDGDNQTFASGGNRWDFIALNCETGLLDINGNLDSFTNATLDTLRNYGLVCIGCNESDWPYMHASFTGPNAYPGATASKGVGAYFGSSNINGAVNNSIGKLTTVFNAADIHFGDAFSSVWINTQTWESQKFVTGLTYSLFPSNKVFELGPLSVSGSTTPQYLARGLVSGTQANAYTLSGLRGQLTGLQIVSGIAPGADTYTAFLQVNHWTGTAYAGWNAVGSCSWTGTELASSFSNSGINVSPFDQVQIVLITSGATFATNQTISAFVTGI